MDLALQAAARAGATSLVELQQSLGDKPDAVYYGVYPGEHYRLLAGIVQTIKPELVVEIGTFTGMSTRVLADYTPGNCRIVTFDIVPWQQFDTHLRAADFTGKCAQVLCDLSDESHFQSNREMLAQADLIFLDGPKDFHFEWDFLQLLGSLHPQRDCWLLIDDIKMWNMLGIWRRVASPKLDLTSFGHWSGSGLVHLSAGLELNTR